MKATQIIQETIDYYSADVSRRATGVGGSCYYEKDGKQCAVGRCLKEDKRSNIFNSWICLVDGIGKEIKPEDKESFFLDKYRGFTVQFWEDLQKLHDGAGFWTMRGISAKGKDYAARLMTKYADLTNA